MRKKTNVVSIFDSDKSQLVLSEELIWFFKQAFRSNLLCVRKDGDEVALFESHINRSSLDEYLDCDFSTDDSTIRVIIDSFEHESFKLELIEEISDFLFKERFDLRISNIYYEYDDLRIKLIVACLE